MNEHISTIEGVANLISQMQQKVNTGRIKLSGREWAEIYDFLAEYEGVLEGGDVNESGLEEVAWQVIDLFEENQTLATHFRAELDALQQGTILTGKLPNKSAKKTLLTTNMPVYLDLIKQAKKYKKA